MPPATPTLTATMSASPISLPAPRSQLPAPRSSDTTSVRKSATNGVAMPSFKPLSTLSARRILTGTARFVKIARPSAASVGARIEAMSAAAAHPAEGKRSTATTVPSAIVSGRPTNSNRPGRWVSPSTSLSRTVEASANSKRASVNSTMSSTGSLVSERWS